MEDYTPALYQVLNRGNPGETYVSGAHNERRNTHVVEVLCALLEEVLARLHPPAASWRLGSSSRRFKIGRGITDVTRLTPVKLRGHKVGGRWKPSSAAQPRPGSGIVTHHESWQRVLDSSYRGERLGLKLDY